MDSITKMVTSQITRAKMDFLINHAGTARKSLGKLHINLILYTSFSFKWIRDLNVKKGSCRY